MATPIAIRRVPEDFPGASIVNENFQALKAKIDRYLATQFWSPLTTKGDLISHTGLANVRVPIGSTNQLLAVQSAYPTWRNLSALMDDVFGSAQGSILYRSGAAWVVLTPGSSGEILQTQGPGANPLWATISVTGINTPGVSFGDGNDAASITPFLTGYLHVPYAGNITGWWIVADVACTVDIEVWLAAGAVPTSGDKISASAGPSLTAAQVNFDTTLTGWTVPVAIGDVLGFYLASVSGSPTQITVVLKVE